MHIVATLERNVEALPLSEARLAGVLYLLAVFTAVFGEFFVHGNWSIAAGLIAVACYGAVTLLLYRIFRPVSLALSLLAAIFNFAGLALEAVRWNPQGVDVAMEFHGLYCLLMGYLIFKSRLLPRFLGALMALAGLVWLINLAPGLANSLSPYNTVVGLLGEASPMLWLLFAGVSTPRQTKWAAEQQEWQS